MFSRWNFARLKVAENALNEGRLDEAFERLATPDMKNQRRARPLLDVLARSLGARARLHAQAGRYQEALADLDRLAAIDRLDADAKALRERVAGEHQQRARRHADEHEAFDQAARDIRAGRLDTGQLAVDRLEDPKRREQLREELDIRVQRSEQLLGQARELLDRGDVLAACRFWEEACQRHGRSRVSDELATELAPACRKLLEEAFDAGRFDDLRTALQAARSLASFAPGLGEYERLAAAARQAAEKLASDDFPGLRDALLRLQAARGQAKWISVALRPLDEILRARSQLLASPLGLFGASLHKSPGFGSRRAAVVS